MASIAAVMRLLRLIDRENSAASATQVVITFVVPNAESPRTRMVPQGPQARAVPMACLIWDAAARPEAARPLRSRASAMTGGAWPAPMAGLRGARPRLRTAARARLAGPAEA